VEHFGAGCVGAALLAAGFGGYAAVHTTLMALLEETYRFRSQTGIGGGANQFGPRRSVFASLTEEF
jgi:hypothetical protein